MSEILERLFPEDNTDPYLEKLFMDTAEGTVWISLEAYKRAISEGVTPDEAYEKAISRSDNSTSPPVMDDTDLLG